MNDPPRKIHLYQDPASASLRKDGNARMTEEKVMNCQTIDIHRKLQRTSAWVKEADDLFVKRAVTERNSPNRRRHKDTVVECFSKVVNLEPSE